MEWSGHVIQLFELLQIREDPAGRASGQYTWASGLNTWF